jgi:hypothetical protein
VRNEHTGKLLQVAALRVEGNGNVTLVQLAIVTGTTSKRKVLGQFGLLLE